MRAGNIDSKQDLSKPCYVAKSHLLYVVSTTAADDPGDARNQGISSHGIDLVLPASAPERSFNTLRPRQNGRHFTDDIFNCIFLNEMVWISIKISLKLVPGVQLTVFQHWFRQWLGADQATSHYLNQSWLVYWRIYASLGLNELMPLQDTHDAAIISENYDLRPIFHGFLVACWSLHN